MARLSIYLPDELEARAKALQPDTSTSQVVRAALERYLGTAAEPAYAQKPDDVDDLLAAGVAHFKALATTDYQRGYRAALKRLPDLHWHALAGFAQERFDLHKWLERWSAAVHQAAIDDRLDEGTPPWFLKLADDLGSLANPVGFDQWNFTRPAPYVKGYADGLHAGFDAAVAAGVMTAAAGSLLTAEEPSADDADNVEDDGGGPQQDGR